MTVEIYMAENILPTDAQTAQPSNPPQKRMAQAIALPQQQARILLVDDEPDILEVLAMSLRMEGYKVQTTDDSREALRLLDEFSPDVMCVDYMMPFMNGQQLAREIRARNDLLYVPIVMLTANSQDNIKFASLDSGVDAFLVKPVKRIELRAVIRTMLRMKTAQDNMLAALERVAEVQDELLEYERQRSRYEANRSTVANYTRELVTPLKTAENAANQLAVLMEHTPPEIQATAKAYLRELMQAVTQATNSLNRLEKAGDEE